MSVVATTRVRAFALVDVVNMRFNLLCVSFGRSSYRLRCIRYWSRTSGQVRFAFAIKPIAGLSFCSPVSNFNVDFLLLFPCLRSKALTSNPNFDVGGHVCTMPPCASRDRSRPFCFITPVSSGKTCLASSKCRSTPRRQHIRNRVTTLHASAA